MSAISDELRWYARLMKLAHELAMEGRGQEAQDLRVAATHARNYRWLRPKRAGSATPLPVQRQNAGAVQRSDWVDRHIADIANSRAKSA